MNKQEFLNALATVLEVAPDRLDDDFVLADGNWDSMSLLEAILVIDRQFGVVVDSQDLWNCKTVGALIAVVESALRRKRVA